MIARGTAARRSVGALLARGALAFAAAALGCVSLSYTFAYATREGNLEHAHALAPTDGRITAMLAQKLSGPQATPGDRVRADGLAREALREMPVAVIAVSTLGLNTQLRGDTAKANGLFSYAERLSRRDLQTQLWAIENAVGRGDVAEALRHYDIALRTTRAASDLLFPILGSAISSPAIRIGLSHTLAVKPPWADGFIQYVADSGPDTRATAELFDTLDRAHVGVSMNARAAVINKLVTQGYGEAAWSYYEAFHKGAQRNTSRDSHFSVDLPKPSIFDWSPVASGAISATIQSNERGGSVDFAAPATVGGPLLQQAQMLPPGRYRLEGHSRGLDQVTDARPDWVLSCTDGRELGRLVLPNSAHDGGRFVGRFTVPTGCPMQMLSLVARPSDAVGGLSGLLDYVRLAPER